ncbi:thioredoxin-like protein [Chytridium lagenaria]|nr:thioredoxin-like protein [Chytridium lagenaria]
MRGVHVWLVVLAILIASLHIQAGKVPQWVEDEYLEASKEIDFITQDNFNEKTATGVWLVFFGIYWCPHCKLLTPKWRDFQKDAKADLLKKNFHIAKVECSENENLCEGEQNIYGFPMIRLFRNGKLIEEVETPEEYVQLVKYANKMADSFIDGSYDKEVEAKEAAEKAEKEKEEKKAASEEPKSEPGIVEPPKKGEDSIKMVEEAAKKAAEEKKKAEDEKKKAEEAKKKAEELEKERKEQEMAEPWLVIQARDFEHGIEKAIIEANEIAGEIIRPKGGVNPNGEVVYLTDKNFKSLTENSDWFIMFHAPWCGHCKNMAPAWAEFAKNMKGKVNVGKVDCTTENTITNAFGIRGFPTLKFVQRGDPGSALEYKGRREVKGFEDFVHQFSKAPFEVVRSSEFDSIFKTKDVSMFYIYNPVGFDKKLLVDFAALAHTTRGQAPLYVSPDPSAFKRLGLEASQSPVFVAVKDGGTERKVFKSDLNLSTDSAQLNLRTWMQENKRSLVAQLDKFNGEEILRGDKLVVVAFLNPSAMNHGSSLGLLRLMAKEWMKEAKTAKAQSVQFVWLDAYENAEYVQRVYKITTRDLPRVVVVHPEVDVYYDVDVAGKPFKFEKDAILGHLKEALGGKLKSKSTSGWLTTIVRKFGLAVKPLADFMLKHSFLLFIGALVFLVGTIYWVVTSSEPGYAPVKGTPKAE